MENQDLEKKIDERIKKILPEYLRTQAFTARKLTDTPTDNLQTVNRKYVNMYGSIAGAPGGSVIGQQYFATDLGYPIFKNQNFRWVNSVGSVIS